MKSRAQRKSHFLSYISSGEAPLLHLSPAKRRERDPLQSNGRVRASLLPLPLRCARGSLFRVYRKQDLVEGSTVEIVLERLVTHYADGVRVATFVSVAVRAPTRRRRFHTTRSLRLPSDPRGDAGFRRAATRELSPRRFRPSFFSMRSKDNGPRSLPLGGTLTALDHKTWTYKTAGASTPIVATRDSNALEPWTPVAAAGYGSPTPSNPRRLPCS